MHDFTLLPMNIGTVVEGKSNISLFVLILQFTLVFDNSDVLKLEGLGLCVVGCVGCGCACACRYLGPG